MPNITAFSALPWIPWREKSSALVPCSLTLSSYSAIPVESSGVSRYLKPRIGSLELMVNIYLIQFILLSQFKPSCLCLGRGIPFLTSGILHVFFLRLKYSVCLPIPILTLLRVTKRFSPSGKLPMLPSSVRHSCTLYFLFLCLINWHILCCISQNLVQCQAQCWCVTNIK